MSGRSHPVCRQEGLACQMAAAPKKSSSCLLARKNPGLLSAWYDTIPSPLAPPPPPDMDKLKDGLSQFEETLSKVDALNQIQEKYGVPKAAVRCPRVPFGVPRARHMCARGPPRSPRTPALAPRPWR
jgi:hypothetical protein